MFETLDKFLLAGLGALSMTKERAEEIFDEYVKRGQAEKESKTGFVKEIVDTAAKTRTDLEKIVSEQVHQAIGKLKLASHEDIKRLEEKLDKLLSKE